MTKEEVIEQLPRVGDIRMEKPTNGDAIQSSNLRKCAVEEVSEKGLWYRVRFLETGAYECYRLPRVRRSHN